MRKKMMNEQVQQVGGNHYDAPIKPWDEFKRLNVTWAQGELAKYLCRWPKKGGIQDLQKALSIVQKYKNSPEPVTYKGNYREEFLEQYRGLYGPLYEDFVFIMKRSIREDWYAVESVVYYLVHYFETHEPYTHKLRDKQ